ASPASCRSCGPPGRAGPCCEPCARPRRSVGSARTRTLILLCEDSLKTSRIPPPVARAANYPVESRPPDSPAGSPTGPVMTFWDAVSDLHTLPLLFLAIALLVAFAFEFINGFHDTANAVTTVIYTRTLTPTPAVMYSGVLNFLGALITVMFFGAAVAFSI